MKMTCMKMWYWISTSLCLNWLLAVTEGYNTITFRDSTYEPNWSPDRRLIQIPYAQTRYYARVRQSDNYILPRQNNYEIDRQSPENTIARISETLGAINTVGKYLVNMTRNGDRQSGLPQEVPGAIYTISKNVLGRNVTDYIREALPSIAPTVPTVVVTNSQGGIVSEQNSKNCVAPDGTLGICDDLSNCPQLLLNLNNLRQSLCFKSLFTPGVCCPIGSSLLLTTQNPLETNTISAVTPFTQTVSQPTPSTPISHIQSLVSTTTKNPVTLPTLLVDPAECGQPEEANYRVVGGTEAQSGTWPWLAAIFLRGTRRTEFWCGGTIISSRHVLTAAHCTKDTKQKSYSPRQFIVRLGDIDLKRDDEPSSPMTYRVNEIVAHPEFSRVGFYNDVAILTLDRPIRKTKYIIPVCLPQLDLENENFAGRRSTVVGWGTTTYGGKESTTQREASLPVWRNEDCNQAYFQPITENFVCAGYADGGTDACQGDSGGPLMLQWNNRWTQIGIVSFGNKCGEPGYPGVYTRITSYIKWIQDNTII